MNLLNPKAAAVHPRSSTRFRPRRRRSAGFTLIELMIAVAIVAILSAIAYPSYRNYVLRGQVVNATNGLSALRANMERFFQDNRTYQTVTSGGTTFTSPCLVTPTSVLIVGTFQLSCSVAPTATAYTLAATGIAGTSTANFVYTVDQNGNMATTVTGVSGWLASCPSSWETKAGSC